ncbi:retinoic acid early transcript 1E [Chlorocebus sabaeus]|uniref:retinoic acid early transcript 1E n=1 Tax=Chlorocebus sabaeus TaxID=60711 RepID=UPI003BF9E2F0
MCVGQNNSLSNPQDGRSSPWNLCVGYTERAVKAADGAEVADQLPWENQPAGLSTPRGTGLVSAPQRVCPETLRKKAVTSGLSILETAEGQTSPAGTRPALSCSRVKNWGSAHTHAVGHFTIPVTVFVSTPSFLPVTLHNVPRMPLTCSPVSLLSLLLLLLTALEIMVGAHSLCFNFTIKSWSRPGQPWCEAQVFMNKNLFLQYDSDSNMVKPLGLLGKKVNATSTWGELTQTLGEVSRDLRMLLLDIKPQIKTSGPSTLQVEMFCQREAERCTGASWQFAINGEKCLFFDAMNMTWTVINHEASKIKATWKKDRGLEKYFRKLSVGDCDHWLREFSEQWEAMPEPTVSPVNVSDIHGSSSSLPDIWIILGAFILFVLMGIFLIIYIRWRKGRRSTWRWYHGGGAELFTCGPLSLTALVPTALCSLSQVELQTPFQDRMGLHS